MPFVLFLLGAAAVGLVAASASAKGKGKGGGGGGRTYTLDKNLPQALRDQVLAALATEKDPGRLLAFAAQCANQGYPLAAAALTQRAVELGGVQPSPLPQPAPSPSVNPIDPNQLPDPPRTQVLAALSTGTDPNALEALAQQMDSQGYTYAAQALRLKEQALRSLQPQPSPSPMPPPGVLPLPSPAPQPLPGPQPGPLPAPSPSPFTLDPGMPPQMQAAVLGALTTETDPVKLQAFAQAIQGTYPIAAGLLMAKANALRLQPGPAPSPTPTPVVPPAPGPSPVPTAPATAVVTTHDPAPLGDLVVFNGINGSKIGGVDKNGTVAVLQWNADGANQWARIAWSGGRNAATSGYVHQAYLQPQPAVAVSAAAPRTAALAKRGTNGRATHA
jgi:hypothetical protein